MSPVFHRMTLYALATVLLVSLHTIHHSASAAPSPWSPKSSAEKLEEDKTAYFGLIQAMLNRLQEVKAKRSRADGGFFSRHDAMSDYLQSRYASDMASDPYGPGKK